jgi:glutathione synthase
MKTLFVMDPLDRINVAGDSTYMLMLEARRRGWPVWMCTPDALFVQGAETWGRLTPVEVQRGPVPFVPGPAEDLPLSGFDVVWMRKDPPFDMAYIFSTYLLSQLPPRVLVLNRPDSIRSNNEKLFTLRFPQLITPTLISREVKRIKQFAAEAPERVVLKPWDGNGGRGVLVTRHGDPNLGSMIELLTGEERHFIIAQHYIPEITKGDKRIILVDGEPRGWMLRVPNPSDNRGNMHAGATVEACPLSARDQEVCATIGPVLRELGLLFVGIDMIGDFLTEINVTSPTGIQEINRLMGTQLEVEVTDAVLARVQALG